MALISDVFRIFANSTMFREYRPNQYYAVFDVKEESCKTSTGNHRWCYSTLAKSLYLQMYQSWQVYSVLTLGEYNTISSQHHLYTLNRVTQRSWIRVKSLPSYGPWSNYNTRKCKHNVVRKVQGKWFLRSQNWLLYLYYDESFFRR